ncbi:hypothetical protein [Methylobacterium sp. J-070]|uniref:hypothetical protein n=1 Tax=Methylobacterium sp. J-070 TaxID=2836650 RepID=UPI001FB9E690|nr:hypothetical protein [Methylobacterium sp. J-070]MCJ2048403.1 hypothetical protein [Methylobacterium sp. J-070]
MTKSTFIALGALCLASGGAVAQGGSPFNSSGSQAGGPLAGMERRAGAPGGAPSVWSGKAGRTVGVPVRSPHRSGRRGPRVRPLG